MFARKPQLVSTGDILVNAIFGGDESWNLLFYQDLQSGPEKMVELINQQKAKYNFPGNDGSRFYIQTTDGAPKGRIIVIDVNHPEQANWKEIVPEQKETLTSAQLVSGKLILSYLKDAHAQAKVAALDGKIQHEIALPGLGGVEWSPRLLHRQHCQRCSTASSALRPRLRFIATMSILTRARFTAKAS